MDALILILKVAVFIIKVFMNANPWRRPIAAPPVDDRGRVRNKAVSEIVDTGEKGKT